MTAFGQPQSLRVLDSLNSDGGTNIAEGLRKAARVVEDI
jgi:Mg-chelatase subunit ChlD